MTKKFVMCDECGKEIELPDGRGRTPFKWFRIENLSLLYKGKAQPYCTGEVEYDDDDDPDFCSEKCLLKWFKKQIKEVTGWH